MAVAPLFVLAAMGMIALGILGGAGFLILRGISKERTGLLVLGIGLLLVPCVLGAGVVWLLKAQRSVPIRTHSEDVGLTPPTPVEFVPGATQPGPMIPRYILEFRAEASEAISAEWKRTHETPAGYRASPLPGAEKQEILFVQRPALDADDVVGATESPDSTGSNSLMILFNEEGTSALAAVTREVSGRRLGIFYRGRLISAPVVREPIVGGRAAISGLNSRSEIDDLLSAFHH